MVEKVNKFLKEKISDKAMLTIGVALICAYYFIGLLSYITVPIRPIFSLLKSSSPIAICLRIFTCGLICLYSLMIVFKYKPKVEWKWLLIFGICLLITLICILISPLTYEYMYFEQLYRVVHVVILNPGVGRTVIMYLSSIADFVFAFCIMFILPFVINNKKKLLWLLLPIVLIGILECGYSFLKEKDNYLYLLNHTDDIFGGYNNEIGATFGNKEDWGSFLIVSISSCLSSILFLENSKKEIVLKVLLVLSFIVMSIFTVLSLCKTAILALFFIVLFLCIGFVIKFCMKSKKSAVISILIFISLIAACVLFFVTDGFGISFLSKFSQYIKKFIIGRSGNALEGRSSLWINYMENIRGYNLFFGMGKNYVNSYTKSLVMEGQTSIHNGFAYFFASYGLVGFLILIVLLVLVLINIIKTWKEDKILVFLFLGLFFAALTFVLAESEVLLISSSTPIFVFNILIVVLPKGIYLKNKLEIGEKA